jgi:hypothetical protein
MWTLYDYRDKNGRNKFKEWTENRQRNQITELNEKLLQLRLNGTNLSPKLLSESGTKHIKKMRFSVEGVQMRPLLCEGPTKNKKGHYNKEFTLLCGATEKGDKFKPTNARSTAVQRRDEVIKNPSSGRVLHVKVLPKPKKQNKDRTRR